MPRHGLWTILLLLGWISVTSPDASAQGVDPENRPIATIRVTGLKLVPEQLVLNQVRSTPGEPYQKQIVDDDIKRITHLGRFTKVDAIVSPRDDGSVELVFQVAEAPLLADVQVVGNKAIPDRKLLERVRLRAGDPAEPFLIDNGVEQITKAYEEEGYFVASVTVDRSLLDDSGILIYRVREGPRIRIVGFDFEGNNAFSDARLQSQVKSQTYFPIFRKGELSRERLELDAAAIRRYYQQHGYLDARCGREIRLSPNSEDAVVIFIIDEGRQYVVDEVAVEGNVLFQDQQLIENMTLTPGAVFSTSQVEASRQAILDMYGRLGFIETVVQIQFTRRFDEEDDQPLIDLVVRIREGSAYLVGKVAVRGNALTRGKVILRQVRGMDPGRPFDRTGLNKTRQRLQESPLFSEATVTILGTPDDEVRDVLIEVEEGQTGQIGFGAGVSSDAGLIGSIDLVQRNFDITDWPESFEEFITGQAFRGAGQFFALTLQPGNETSRYSVSFREPYLLETDYFLDTNAFFFEREREDWDEQRIGAIIGLGQRFGDVWSASARFRIEQVDISDIDPSAPVDAFAVAGDNLVSSLGFTVIRDTTDQLFEPSRGSRFEATLEQVFGDFTFTRARVQYIVFFTVDEDFLGRKSILSWRTEIGYIFQKDEAPLFERFYAGGQRSFRGFEFRGVGPRGIRADTGTLGDDPVGGDWMFLTGLQYEFPVIDEFLRAVIFTDQGTVQDDFGLDEWRVSIGAGVRLKIPFLIQAPLAVDVAYPILKESGDQTQIISFDLAIPLR